MEKPVYIHYGAKVFDPGKGFPIRNRENWTKPAGELWASRETSAFGWKDWCERESFRVCDASNTFRFVLRDVAEVGWVSRMDDLKRLPNKAGKLWAVIPDFEECLCRGYDAFALLASIPPGLPARSLLCQGNQGRPPCTQYPQPQRDWVEERIGFQTGWPPSHQLCCVPRRRSHLSSTARDCRLRHR